VVVHASFEESRHRHGSPRIHADLIEQQIHVSRKRVVRLVVRKMHRSLAARIIPSPRQ
jgi:hypothetical protein